MAARVPAAWVPRWLFASTVVTAAAVIVLIVLAPVFDPGTEARGGGRILSLFARDGFVRRTALACALGVFATGWIFFRPQIRRSARAKPPSPPENIVGA